MKGMYEPVGGNKKQQKFINHEKDIECPTTKPPSPPKSLLLTKAQKFLNYHALAY